MLRFMWTGLSAALPELSVRHTHTTSSAAVPKAHTTSAIICATALGNTHNKLPLLPISGQFHIGQDGNPTEPTDTCQPHCVAV